MRIVAGLAATLFALALWQGIVMLTGVPRFILPGPELVAQTWWSSRALIADHALDTLTAIILGLGLGASLGIAVALALAMSQRARTFVQPLLIFSQTLPVFALAPLLTLWLGFGMGSKVAMAVLLVFFPVASAFLDGLLRTPNGYLDLANTMQARPLAVLWHIRIPAALPALASGLRLSAVYAPIGAVIGEWVGSSQGLGYLMLLANGRSKTDLMFAALFTLSILSIILYYAVKAATEPWSRQARHSG
ncbi:MAG: ABC transporter permease [Pseudomonadota bacterium]